MLLKKSEIIGLFEGLKFLSRCSCTEKGFYAYRKNLRLLAPLIDDIDATQKKMIEKIPSDFIETNKDTGQMQIKPAYMTEPPTVAFFEEKNKFLDSTDEIELHKVDLAELKVAENKIANGVLDLLFPILNESKEV